MSPQDPPVDPTRPQPVDPTRPPVHIPLHDFLALDFRPPAEQDEVAEVRMPVAANAFGFTRNLHGGAIATLVDVACALAATRSSGHDPYVDSLVTADMHVRYLGRPHTDTVVAKARVVRQGKTLIVIECRVVDEEEHLVAVADFSMMKVALRRPLDGGEADVSGAPEL